MSTEGERKMHQTYYAKMEGVVGETNDPKLTVEPLTDSVLREWNEDWSRLRIVLCMDRPGIMDASMAVEKQLYPPDSPENAKFSVVMFPWQGFDWWVAAMPLQDKSKVVAVLERAGFCLASSFPKVGRGPNGFTFWLNVRKVPPDLSPVTNFPINNPRTFTVEPVQPGPTATMAIQKNRTAVQATADFLGYVAFVERVIARVRTGHN